MADNKTESGSNSRNPTEKSDTGTPDKHDVDAKVNHPVDRKESQLTTEEAPNTAQSTLILPDDAKGKVTAVVRDRILAMPEPLVLGFDVRSAESAQNLAIQLVDLLERLNVRLTPVTDKS